MNIDHVAPMEPTVKIRMQARSFASSFPYGDKVRCAYEDAQFADGFPHSYTESAVHTGRELIWAMSAGDLTDKVLELVEHIYFLHDCKLWDAR